MKSLCIVLLSMFILLAWPQVVASAPAARCAENCPKYFNPICGAKNRTNYMNLCEATCAAESQAVVGSCCNITTQHNCSESEICVIRECPANTINCTTVHCAPSLPLHAIEDGCACPSNWEPVCDMTTQNTYPNECTALCENVKNMTLEACTTPRNGQVPSRCLLPMVTGPCKAFFRRYGYDPEVQTCRLFVYGGCRGNLNNFRTLQECLDACVNMSGVEDLENQTFPQPPR